MTRSTEKTRNAIASASSVLPEPPVTMSQRELKLYALVMTAVSPGERRSAVARALAAGIAVAMAEIETCGEIIQREGLVVSSPQGTKPNPAVGIRDVATKRLAALASRLKALPQADARELARATRFESVHRGSAQIVAGSSAKTPRTDWVAVMKEEFADD